ncbi:hypothetical protein SLEP1_g8866 [Rubroshorea leprosula]|uniref:Uncharacterized protein n=1 Tax=Rubroshorea leprosula TaxID=152421 RepID=A0AAV5IE86_9ROSI|nr:hypothetical protein SLEP1_g8866 [Rubroshorea leprosula]
MLGDSHQNPVQPYTDSLKDIFQQTMLQQEIAFRNQVHELHRLYGIQKTIMKDIGPQTLETYGARATAQPLAWETGFPSHSINLVGPLRPAGQELLEGYAGNYSEFKPRPIDLQLSADQYVSHVDSGNTANHLKEIPDLNSPYLGDGSDLPELRLSPNLEVDNRREEITRTNSLNQKTSSCSPVVIDLEESDDVISIMDSKRGFPFVLAVPTNFGGKHDSQVTIPSDPLIFGGMKKDASHAVAESSYFLQESKSCQELKSSTQGHIDCHGSMHNNLSTSKQPQISCEVGHIDLNKAQFDDSSCFSNDPVVAHPCKVVRHSTYEKAEEADDTVFLCSDQSQVTVEERGSNSFDKHSSIADNDSSSGKIMQSSGNPTHPASDQFSGTNVGAEALENIMGEQDQRSSGRSELKADFNKKEELHEVNVLMEQAAQSLIQISMENSACNQNLSTKAGSNEMENEEQPQCSSDSYELIALKLTESSVDDYSVSSKPSEVSDSERKDYSFKLRRGRRLKDFQRDILPGLSSLSRQEIREDINILEAVLRSREYKKMRSNMANAETWSAPLRSRRSKVSYGGRRKSR